MSEIAKIVAMRRRIDKEHAERIQVEKEREERFAKVMRSMVPDRKVVSRT